MHAFDARRRGDLAHLHEPDLDLVGIGRRHPGLRLGEPHAAGAQRHLSLARLVARAPRRHHDLAHPEVGPGVGLLEQLAAGRHLAVVARPDHQAIAVRHAGQQRIEVPFPVSDMDAPGCSPHQPEVGTLHGCDPAHGLLFLHGAGLAPFALAPGGASPDLGVEYPDKPLAVRVHSHRGVDEEALGLAVGTRPQPLAAAVAARKVDLRRVLDCDDAAALGGCRGACDVNVEDRLGRDLRRGEEAPGGQLAAASAAKATRHQRAGCHDLRRYDVSAPVEPDISEAAGLHAPSAAESVVGARESYRRHQTQLQNCATLRLTCVNTVARRV